MNEINKRPLKSIGYGFIAPDFLPEGKDEYHLRNLQNRTGTDYRHLSAYEIEVLVRNNNTSDDWNKIQVSDAFNPDLVRNCKFFGLVRIGKLEAVALEYHNVAMPVGLYNSTIISCDFGDNVVVSNVNYLAHYIIGNEVMLCNIHELHTTSHAKFGNGILKEGEDESIRIWIEVCNENGGRKIIPFNGMLPGDAWLWSKYRDDAALMHQLKLFTEKKFDKQRGYYGKVGDRTVIKNTSIIKDVWVGTDAYIKGANKLKNLTINSSPESRSQIGEGCELVNGIVGYGCRIFYGVKAVRFVMASHSQLKYGARLINSYLGNNATISCCEVLNSLIFPAHEQHHNNSFLCAALVMGQSNIAAGATIGSNHNSRAADGELVAGRGFWPGLCVSLKHNSRFASFTLLAKGDYSYELDVPLPFSLVSNDVTNNRLVIMPAYWFMHNMYALARNAHKYVDRDKRARKIQNIEYDFLAPDSVNEIFQALDLLRRFTAEAYDREGARNRSAAELVELGEQLLGNPESGVESLTILATGFENNNRPTLLIKVREAYRIYRELITYYGVWNLLPVLDEGAGPESLQSVFAGTVAREAWTNIGSQLVPASALDRLLKEIRTGAIGNWEEVHGFYTDQGRAYAEQKRRHALASLLENAGITLEQLDGEQWNRFLKTALHVKEWMVHCIAESRAKDYQSAFRKMVYNNDEEMEEVVGRLEDNVFIHDQQEELSRFRTAIQRRLQGAAV